MYVDYTFYTDIYGGSLIGKERFPLFSDMALKFIGSMVLSPFTLDTDVKMAVCHLADIFFRDSKRRGISSENNDGYSVNYDKNSSPYKMAAEIASVYLKGKGLLYCGIG